MPNFFKQNIDKPVKIGLNFKDKWNKFKNTCIKIWNILYVTSILLLVFFTALYFLQYRLVVRFENISPLLNVVM